MPTAASERPEKSKNLGAVPPMIEKRIIFRPTVERSLEEVASDQLLLRYQQGDEDASREIFERFIARLTALARSRLASRVAKRADPEDIVLSAYRSFFVGARNGKYALQRSGDLWRLLVSITLHK